MNEHHSRFDIDRFNRPPTLSEYATAKKEYEIGVDVANGEDCSVEMIVDLDTLLLMYWNTIPKNKKRIIKVGDNHETTRVPSKPA